ncbi:MAG: hypothetical protein DWH79_02770 [Planctomycetota bacterium]|nr:MAG: hypothetical protein DWH79_02770 [Planctomycetota bacterium]
MAARRLVTPDQPAPVRAVLATYEFLASLQFAVVLIALLGIVLGLGTFVESGFGTEAVKFGVWNTWWFTLLNALLAVSIFCAAAIRYPWKRHQTGFVITHIGLLTLLTGCFLSQRGGIDAQLPLLEGQKGGRAFEDSHHFSLLVRPSSAGRDAAGTTVGPIRFRSGPFNWEEFGGPSASNRKTSGETESGRGAVPVRRNWFPWGLAPRDQGVLHDADGVRLEVLDFYADSTAALAPSVKLRIGTDSFEGAGAEGMWMPVDLAWQPDPLRGAQLRHRGSVGGGTVVFWKLSSEDEAEAFLLGTPDPKLGFGTRGQLVLVADGKAHRVLVDDLVGQPRAALDGTELFVELSDFQDQLSAARLKVRRGIEGIDEEMVVLADLPEVTVHAPRTGVQGTLWIERETSDASERMQGRARSRIDIVQAPSKGLKSVPPGQPSAPNHRLLYRRWQAPLVTAGELPIDGSPVPAFEMPRAKLEMRLDRFLPADQLEIATLPLPFSKDKAPSSKRRAARVRLSVDGKAEEFWLAGIPVQPIDEAPSPTEERTVSGPRRSVTVRMMPDAIDIGFDIKLDNFERKLDPGTSQASHFSSLVEFLDRSGRALVSRPVTITMNAPVDFSDPGNGRSYRLFQESFMGPWMPGDDLYEKFTKNSPEKPEKLEASVLTVNYDPGRGVKYLGCGLIVAGIFTMFYMRAYFFRPRRDHGDDDTPSPRHAPVATGTGGDGREGANRGARHGDSAPASRRKQRGAR